MKRTTQHILSLLLTCAMLLSLLPAVAFAEEPETAPNTAADTLAEPAPVNEPEPESDKIVYVSSAGSDETGDGTQDNPYATLFKAVEKAEDGSTIHVLTDLTIADTRTARVTDKHLTITSADPENPVTLTRGKNVTAADNHQSWYNGALIEVTTSDAASGTSDNAASVTLKNIVLTDDGKHDGTYFAQTNSTINGAQPENGNLAFVQDAVVTAHGLSDRRVNITLGEGAVLQDFGGMSAVYATGNVQITMQSGSVIKDIGVTDRVRSDTIKNCPPEEVGPAGAVWLQGSCLVMEEGSEIRNITGRAVYADGGSAVINGTISDISSDADMWQGKGGVAVHVRNNADVTFGSTALFDNTNVSAKIDSAVYVNQGSFEMADGAKICNLAGTAIMGYGSTTQPADSINIMIDGEICGIINGGNAINLNESGGLYCKIGPNADIHHNTVWAATLYAQGPGIVIDLYGTIRDNTSTQYSAGIWLANNFTGARLTMYDGAKITGNTSVNDGAAVIVSRGSFIMDGGSISNNCSVGNPSLAGGVSVRRSGSFTMNAGEITSNITTGYGGGVQYNDDSWGNECVILNGGTISDNIMNVTATLNGETGKYDFTDGVSNDISVSTSQFGHISRYMTISGTMDLGNPTVYLEKYNVTLTPPGSGVKFGNASDAGITSVTSAAVQTGWSDTVLAALWAVGSEPVTALEISKPAGAAALPIYAGVVAVGENGEPVAGAPVCFYPVAEQNGKLTIRFPNSINGSALALVQPTADYGFMTASAPATLVGKTDVDKTYQIPYCFTYTVSDNLKNRLKAGEALRDISIQIHLNEDLTVDPGKITFTSDIFAPGTITYENGLLTIPCTMKDGWENAANWNAIAEFSAALPGAKFSEGTTLAVSGDFNAQIAKDQSKIFVPSDPAVTLLKSKALITAIAGPNGTITPDSAEVDYGGSATFTITANDGYHISDIKVDGQSVAVTTSYKFESVTTDHTIEASFAENGTTTRYTISASAGEGGSISPSGSVRVSRGGSKTFTMKADEGYEIDDVLVD
ncbi:MAG: hypothetical protein MSB10_05905, partial [Clostridiales bacterium]|nr:hypothetical protein [Clostridiales bacterium]